MNHNEDIVILPEVISEDELNTQIEEIHLCIRKYCESYNRGWVTDEELFRVVSVLLSKNSMTFLKEMNLTRVIG